MFTKVIANPPFVKSSSLSKKIVNALLENKVAEEYVVLAPPKTFWYSLPYLDSFHTVGGISSLFDTSPKERGDLLACGLLKKEKIKDPKYTHPFDLAQITDKQRQLMKAVTAYNKSHISHIVLIDGSSIEPKWEKPLDACTKFPKSDIFKDKLSKKLKDLIKDQEVFVKTAFAVIDGVHFNDCHDFKYNLRNEYDMKWNKGGRHIDLFAFVNKQERDNFSDWWYSCNKVRTSKKERIGLTNAFLDLMVATGRWGAGYFREYFPNLDWSHPWIDQEILREIGLPEDFLEE